MSNHNNVKEIRSLEHTIKCHRSYIQELKTNQYRGAVTDERIQTMNNQIAECETTIQKLKSESETVTLVVERASPKDKLI